MTPGQDSFVAAAERPWLLGYPESVKIVELRS
eukprot:CAMPEP_0172618318 /NCGR_PEP_ID=MMETSP1068-20121228/79171_1 /TAXON_ID=35684 /ORGANISM="Pseudopedinella elastica, Strain CCMP716" /LENGTH=31 /DNA_ID= /DNA_START= /DNA_END= /DNA_ORIENTATION=